MDEQHVTLLVLLDLSAAFESDLGITDNALAWFKSYLSDRFQRVFVNGSLSDQFKTRCSSRIMFEPLAFYYLQAQTRLPSTALGLVDRCLSCNSS